MNGDSPTTLTKDLVTELRALVQPQGITSIARESLFVEAADEIERLRRELQLARAALDGAFL